MNRTLKFSLVTALAVAGTSMFVACGGDSGTSSKNKNAEINDYAKLPSCTLKNDAERASVNDDENVYVCKDSKWEILDTSFVANDTAKTLDDIPNCADEQDGNSYYIQKVGVNYICENNRWEIVIVKKEEAKSSSSVASGKDDSKSSGSTAKSSASKDPDVIPGTDPEPQGGSSSSSASKDEAKSSASKDDAKSSGSTAKSSASTGKSSSSIAANRDSSSSTTKNSSSSKAEDAVASLDDLPNCTATRLGEVYYVTSEKSSVICTENRTWEKVLDCGGKTYGSESYFCAGGKAYEKCDGKDFNPVYQRCESSIIVRNVKNESSVTHAYGYEKVYSVGDSVYSDFIMFGEVLNRGETGCYETGMAFGSEIDGISETIISDPYSEAMKNFFANSKSETFVDSCDYYARYTRKAKVSEDFSFEEFKTGSNEFYAAWMLEPNESIGLYEPRPDGKIMCGEGIAAVDLNVERQFCYKGFVYDRCGGSTFATSEIYNPRTHSCVDGKKSEGFNWKRASNGVEYTLTRKGNQVEYIEKNIGSSPFTDYGGCTIKFNNKKDSFSPGWLDYILSLTDEELVEEYGDRAAWYKFEAVSNKNFVDSCDYYFKVIMTKEIDKDFAETDVEKILTYLENDIIEADLGRGSYEFCAPSTSSSTAEGLHDVEKTFCYNGSIYDRCGGSSFKTSFTYNPYEYKCVDGILKKLLICGWYKYDESIEFCYNNEVYKNDSYTPCMTDDVITGAASLSSEFCFNGAVYKKCGAGYEVMVEYNPDTQICENYKVVNKSSKPTCGTEIYDPTSTLCVDGKLYDKNLYELCSETVVAKKSSEFCYEGNTLSREEWGLCGESVYKISEEFCTADNKVENLCGGKTYNPSAEFCSVDNKVVELCGGATYDPATQFCFEGDAYASEEYLACKNSSGEVVSVAGEFQFCFDGKAYDNATYDVCKNSDDEETAVYNKSTEFCFNGGAYASDSYAQCNNEIVEKLETGVCVSNGTDSIYVEMPEELYIVNDLVKMKTYSVSGFVKTWTGSGLTTPTTVSRYRTKLIEDQGYEESSVAGTYVMADGAFEYSIALEVSTLRNGRTSVKVTATQAPKKTIKD